VPVLDALSRPHAPWTSWRGGDVPAAEEFEDAIQNLTHLGQERRTHGELGCSTLDKDGVEHLSMPATYQALPARPSATNREDRPAADRSMDGG
jgi:hypothetical protein